MRRDSTILLRDNFRFAVTNIDMNNNANERRKAKALLETIGRNRVVPRFVAHHLHFHDCTENAVSQCVRTLRRQDWVQDVTIVGQHKALTPARRLARTYGLPMSSAANPLARQPLEQNLGATLFCALDRPRKRLLPSELRAEFPWFPKSLGQRPVYFDYDNGTRRLAVIRVELAASSFRIVRKHQKEIYKCCDENIQFRKLVDSDQFMLVTITATPEAAQQVADQISRVHAYPRAKVMAWPEKHLHLILSRR